ncbi:MAG: energy transducer TonB, partial [Bacteroidota bacterium]
NVDYPAEMQESTIDGMVVLEIRLNQMGKIRSTKVVDSRSKHFDISVIEAMEKMEAIKIDGPFYYGVMKFQVPIQFSID